MPESEKDARLLRSGGTMSDVNLYDELRLGGVYIIANAKTGKVLDMTNLSGHSSWLESKQTEGTIVLSEANRVENPRWMFIPRNWEYLILQNERRGLYWRWSFSGWSSKPYYILVLDILAYDQWVWAYEWKLNDNQVWKLTNGLKIRENGKTYYMALIRNKYQDRILTIRDDSGKSYPYAGEVYDKNKHPASTSSPYTWVIYKPGERPSFLDSRTSGGWLPFPLPPIKLPNN